jgi:hypothetical protein
MTSMGDSSLQLELVPTGLMPEPDTDQGTVDAGWAAITSLVGVVEAWPSDARQVAVGEEPSSLAVRIVPGAALHPTHRLADDDEHRLVRPSPGQQR